MPSQDIPCQIYRIPTYTETLADIKSRLINLIINFITQLLHSTFFFPPTMCLLPRTIVVIIVVVVVVVVLVVIVVIHRPCCSRHRD